MEGEEHEAAAARAYLTGMHSALTGATGSGGKSVIEWEMSTNTLRREKGRARSTAAAQGTSDRPHASNKK